MRGTRTSDADKLKELIDRADARLAEYFQQLDAGDAAEPGIAALSKTNWRQRSRRCRNGRTGTKNCWISWMRSRSRCSVTDPDTRQAAHWLRGTHGSRLNAQMAVNAKHKLIAAADVTNEGTDYQQLAGVALGSQDESGIDQNGSGGRRGLLQCGGSQPVRGTTDHTLSSQGGHQREHQAWTLRQKPVQV